MTCSTDSSTISFSLPAVDNVMTVSGVASIDLMRSQFRTNFFPFSRLNSITWVILV